MCVSGFKCTATFCSVDLATASVWYCSLNILSRREANEMIIFYSITKFSSLIPDSAGSNSDVILYAVKPGHMWQSEKAEGGTIIGQGGILKPARCWLGHQPSSDIYTGCRVSVQTPEKQNDECEGCSQLENTQRRLGVTLLYHQRNC